MKNLEITRFIEAHKHSYQSALAEIRNGRKTSHWMWYIFPQIHNATEVFGKLDDIKLKSSMTLFALVPDSDPVFQDVLNKYFGGKRDYRTLKILELI